MSSIDKVKIVKDIVIDCLSKKPFMSAPEIDYSKESVKLAKEWKVPKNYTIVNKVLKNLLAEGVISERKREGTAKTREFSMNSDYVEPEIDEELEAEEPEELIEDLDEVEEPELDKTEEEEMQEAIDEVIAEDEDDWEVESDDKIDDEEKAQLQYFEETGKKALTSRKTLRKDYISWKKKNWN